MVLDHDRPLPDLNQVLFDLKNTMMLEMLSQQQHQHQYQHAYGPDGEVFGSVNNANRRFSTDLNYAPTNANLNVNTHMANQHQHHHDSVHLNINHGIIQNSVFSCVNSLNKLRTMLTEWCDVVLVENCVYLKFLVSSTKYNRRKLVEHESLKKQTEKTLTSGGDLLNTVVESSNATLASMDVTTSNTDAGASASASASNSSPVTTPSVDKVGANTSQSSSVTASTSTAPASASPLTKNSFVMIKVDYRCVPYVSLQFLFHSNVSYSDRTRLIENFKCRINEFR